MSLCSLQTSKNGTIVFHLLWNQGGNNLSLYSEFRGHACSPNSDYTWSIINGAIKILMHNLLIKKSLIILETPVMRRVLGLSIGTVVLAIVIFMVWAKRQQELHAKKNRQQSWCWINSVPNYLISNNLLGLFWNRK